MSDRRQRVEEVQERLSSERQRTSRTRTEIVHLAAHGVADPELLNGCSTPLSISTNKKVSIVVSVGKIQFAVHILKAPLQPV